jgi:hypothetical protein
MINIGTAMKEPCNSRPFRLSKVVRKVERNTKKECMLLTKRSSHLLSCFKTKASQCQIPFFLETMMAKIRLVLEAAMSSAQAAREL